MRLHEALALVICAALAAACSSQSRNTKPVAGAQVPAVVDPSLAKVDPGLIKEGYRAVRRQGKLLYCKTQTVTGTKFGTTKCATAEQIHESERETELSKQQLIRSGPANCVGTQCSK
jgi:hypothetical protein